MKKVIVLFISFLALNWAVAQESNTKAKIYNPNADAKQEVIDALKNAKETNRFVLIQVGGNWCPWCLKFHKYAEETSEIKSLIDSNYVYTLVNYSRENKNEELLKSLGNPGRFGFPVFVILNSDGKVIHIQDSGYLEDGKEYSKEKILRFVKLWSPKAVNQ